MPKENPLDTFAEEANQYASKPGRNKNTRNYHLARNEFIKDNFNEHEFEIKSEIKRKLTNNLNQSVRGGQLALIAYKTDDHNLMFYDRMAVSLILRLSAKFNTLYGLNFHYMPDSEKITTIRALKKDTIDFPLRTIHSYKLSRRMYVYNVPPRLWDTFIFYPIENFVKPYKRKEKGRIKSVRWRKISKNSVERWCMKSSKRIKGNNRNVFGSEKKKLQTTYDPRIAYEISIREDYLNRMREEGRY